PHRAPRPGVGQAAPQRPRVHDAEPRFGRSRAPARIAPAGCRQSKRHAGRDEVSAPLILVVEDNETNQMLTVAVLERDGYRVVVAGNTSEAREQIKTEAPHLILMDVQLPGEDRLASTRQLTRNPTTSPI